MAGILGLHLPHKNQPSPLGNINRMAGILGLHLPHKNQPSTIGNINRRLGFLMVANPSPLLKYPRTRNWRKMLLRNAQMSKLSAIKIFKFWIIYHICQSTHFVGAFFAFCTDPWYSTPLHFALKKFEKFNIKKMGLTLYVKNGCEICTELGVLPIF